MAKDKVVLAYSGGLDTTAIIPWLKENYGYEVICCCVDCGQGEELDGLEERARYCGASKLYIEDITDSFAEDYIIPCVMADAVYENKYLLGTSMARPGIAKKLVEIARKEDAVAICHGATGKGNDQIRFELSIKALAPDIEIIAPWRDDKWTLESRQDEIDYCKAHGIDLPFDVDESYSRDRNLWHISHEGLELEDPSLEPDYKHLLVLSKTPQEAPDVAEDIGNKLAQVVYEGKWFTPLSEALRAFVLSTQTYVTGQVKFRLYKGNIIKAGTTSPYSLYSESLASFTTGDQYDHHDAQGFITLFGLPLKVRAQMLEHVEKKAKSR